MKIKDSRLLIVEDERWGEILKISSIPTKKIRDYFTSYIKNWNYAQPFVDWSDEPKGWVYIEDWRRYCEEEM